MHPPKLLGFLLAVPSASAAPFPTGDSVVTPTTLAVKPRDVPVVTPTGHDCNDKCLAQYDACISVHGKTVFQCLYDLNTCNYVSSIYSMFTSNADFEQGCTGIPPAIKARHVPDVAQKRQDQLECVSCFMDCIDQAGACEQTVDLSVNCDDSYKQCQDTCMTEGCPAPPIPERRHQEKRQSQEECNEYWNNCNAELHECIISEYPPEYCGNYYAECQHICATEDCPAPPKHQLRSDQKRQTLSYPPRSDLVSRTSSTEDCTRACWAIWQEATDSGYCAEEASTYFSACYAVLTTHCSLYVNEANALYRAVPVLRKPSAMIFRILKWLPSRTTIVAAMTPIGNAFSALEEAMAAFKSMKVANR